MSEEPQVRDLAESPAQTDWSYAAGFVDGEGCISILRSFVPHAERYVYGVAVVVSNRDRGVLEWMRATWGGWVVGVPSHKGRARAGWNWRSPSGLAAKQFLAGIQPWLRIKGPQCANALEMIDILQRSRRTLGPALLPQSWLEEQEKHYWIQRELNHRGSDLYVAKPMHSPRKINRERAQSATFGI